MNIVERVFEEIIHIPHWTFEFSRDVSRKKSPIRNRIRRAAEEEIASVRGVVECILAEDDLSRVRGRPVLVYYLGADSTGHDAYIMRPGRLLSQDQALSRVTTHV